MKRNIKMFLAITVLTGAFFIGCNSGSDTSTTESIPGKDSGTTSTMAADTSKAITSTPKKKKGKASAMMMTAPEKPTTTMNTDKTGYYASVETLPAYPGGQSALDQFFNDNVEYPQDAIDHNTEGTVMVHFGIDDNGKVTNATTTGTVLGNGLEAEAVRVINKMPAWTPGMVKGKKVKAYYSLPIRFQLAE